jgi:hypothetical protein
VVAQACGEALAKFSGLLVDKLAVFCEPQLKSSAGMKHSVLSNHDTDEDEDVDDQTQWSKEMLRCQLWVRQVLFEAFSASGSILPANYSHHSTLVTRLARGLAFSGSQDGDHDNVKGARGGQWSAAVLVSSFDLLAVLISNADTSISIKDELLVTSLVGVGTFEHHDIAHAAERYISAMYAAFPAECVNDFCTNGCDIITRAMDVADMTTIRPIFGFVRALVDVSTGTFVGGGVGRSTGGGAAGADDPVLDRLMRCVLDGIQRNSVFVWRETSASMHGVLELCRCNRFVAKWCSKRIDVSVAGAGARKNDQDERVEEDLFGWWDTFFAENPDVDHSPDCAEPMRVPGSATAKIMLHGRAVLRSSGASRASAGTGMPRSPAKRGVVDNYYNYYDKYNSYNSYNSYNNPSAQRQKRERLDHRKKKANIGCVDPDKASILETLQRMREWRSNTGEAVFGGESWQEPVAVHWRPPSWSRDRAAATEGNEPVSHAKSLVARRAEIQWDDGSYECSIASWNPLTGEHKCVFDDGDIKCYNLYRRWGVRLLPRGSLPPSGSKVPAELHQANYDAERSTATTTTNASSSKSTRSSGRARVIQTGRHSSDEDSEENTTFSGDDDISWANNFV